MFFFWLWLFFLVGVGVGFDRIIAALLVSGGDRCYGATDPVSRSLNELGQPPGPPALGREVRASSLRFGSPQNANEKKSGSLSRHAKTVLHAGRGRASPRRRG